VLRHFSATHFSVFSELRNFVAGWSDCRLISVTYRQERIKVRYCLIYFKTNLKAEPEGLSLLLEVDGVREGCFGVASGTNPLSLSLD
jgi:hypothetical protein